jgi:hypothetical protein
MKKHLLVAVMASCAFAVNAQKLEKPMIDKISGDITLSTKEQVLSNPFTIPGHYLAGYIIKGKGYCELCFHLKDGLDIDYYVLKGYKGVIKFTDGKLLEINALFDKDSSPIPDASPPVTQSFLSFDLTNEDITALENGKVSVIRIMTSQGAFDYEIKDGKSEIIKKQLELITKR